MTDQDKNDLRLFDFCVGTGFGITCTLIVQIVTVGLYIWVRYAR